MTRIVVPLFALTLFVGSFLMFTSEPMTARQLLPILGGTPMVWNGCVVFFQVVLLLGYGGAHALTNWVGWRVRLLVYATIALVSFPLLKLHIDPASAIAVENAPLAWLLRTLVTTVGLPFMVLAVSASVIQASLAASSHKSARDPYFLYVASNAGSLAALIAYPSLVEPWLGLAQQAWAWRIAYAVFVALLGACAGVVLFVLSPRGHDQALAAADEDSAEMKILTVEDRVRWCALAAVPSSLMLGVTTALTTDIAPIPLLWVAPLGLYLATFIVAFSAAGPRATALASRGLPIALLVLAFILLLHVDLPVGAGLLAHLVPFILAAMVCHGSLAATRPSSKHLTEFYLWLAFGGMLGGVFNTLVAPTLFSVVLEYPIALALVAILRPTAPDDNPRWSRDIWLPLLTILGLAALRYLPWSRPHLPYVLGGVAFLVTVTFVQRHRRWAFAGVVAALLLSGPWVSLSSSPVLHRARTFFGTYAVRADAKHHVLNHGTTMHGMQALEASRRYEPLTYYHRTGPFGQMMASIPRLRQPGQIAVIGLGVGSLAAYREPGQQWTFYEIDAAMERIARDERLFTFLARCGASCGVVLGDARLSLAATQDARYQLIALDAFTSDAIPLHLLTEEAMQVYVAKLAPRGVIAVHISNRHLQLAPIVARLAEANGLTSLHRVDRVTKTQWPDGKSPSEWIVMARSRVDLDKLTDSPGWTNPTIPPSIPLWTDDFTHILGVLRFGTN